MDLAIQCIGCFHLGCTGNCFAQHRDRYGCHNPQCIYHVPCPAPVEPNSDSDVEEIEEDDDASTATVNASTANTTITRRSTQNTATTRDGDLVYRETITREYRLVNGQVVELPRQLLERSAFSTATNSVQSASSPQVVEGSTSTVAITNAGQPSNANNTQLAELLEELRITNRHLAGLQVEADEARARASSSRAASDRSSRASQRQASQRGSPAPSRQSDGAQSRRSGQGDGGGDASGNS